MSPSYITRMERAFDRFAKLRAEIQEYCESRPFTFSSDIRPGTPEEVAKFAAVPNQPPDPVRVRDDGRTWILHQTTIQFSSQAPLDEWTLTVAEILQHFHSSLDYLVHDLNVKSTGKNPPPNVRSLQFPVVLRANDWKNEKRRLGMVGAAVEERVRECQPYNGDKKSPQQWAVAVLHDLNNRSKHRSLIHVGLKPNEIRVEGVHTLTNGYTPMVAVELGRLETGTAVARCMSEARFDSFGVSPDLGLQVAIPHVITSDGRRNLGVITTLESLGNAVFTLIRDIERLASLESRPAKWETKKDA